MVEVKPERPEPTYILRLVQIATILLTPLILFFTLTLIQINRCSIELENDTKIVDFVQKPLIEESNHDQSHFPEQVNDIPLTPPGIDESLPSTNVDLFPQSPEDVHLLDHVIFTPSKDIAKFNPQVTPEEISPFEQIFKPENSFPIMDAWNPDGQISSTIVQKLFDELNKYVYRTKHLHIHFYYKHICLLIF